MALLVISCLGLLAEWQNRTIYQHEIRSDVASRLSLVRARLEGNLGGDLQLIRGLVATLSTRPDLDQDQFARLVAVLMESRTAVRHVAAAPGLVVRMVYPLAGNERALGLDYAANPSQREGALRARDTGQLVLSGPLRLVQGGEGLIGRFPVFTRGPDGSRAFWGIVSAVIDVELLLRSSGVSDPELGLDIAVAGRDGTGAGGEIFYGSAEIWANDPVLADVQLPSGTWMIAAVPTDGWRLQPPNTVTLVGLVVFAGLFVAVPVLVIGRLYSERREYVSEIAQRRAELEKLSNRLELALDASKVGVWEMDIATKDLVWDDRMHELYDVPRTGEPISESTWSERLHPDDMSAALADFDNAIRTRQRYFSEFRVLLPGDVVRTIRTVGAVRQLDGRDKIIGVNWDVTADVALTRDLQTARCLAEARSRDLEEANRTIEHASLHDALTGLPNRRYLTQYLGELEQVGGTPVAVLHLDLDRFKQINDTLGHAAGDAVLLHAASVMRDVFRQADFVARIGGDEFVAVLVERDVEVVAARLADALVTAMKRPVLHEGHHCRLGISVGIAVSADGRSSRRLLVDADIALYRAKNRGRGRYEFYTETIHGEIITTKRIADEILTGLEQGQFVPFYQPQYDARTRCMVGVEALARWRHPTEGLLAPDRFLKIAEDINMVSAIDRIILVQVLADRRRWRSKGLDVPRIAVNVSLKRLHEQTLVCDLKALDIEPGSLSFELLESIYLDEQNELVSWNIDGIRELGIALEIDDFGTGHASILSLVKLRPDRFKIDRQLTADVVSNPAQRQLVRSLVEIGQAMAVGIVAEGVETAAQADVLAQIGCETLQGFHFSRPMDPLGMERLLAAAGSVPPAPERRAAVTAGVI
ncbi:bifunctional diguanylate cyclase/phosphodiesterase [Chthonobacter rhizosphaerae]|uniref:bifunctional diguanylate cyclase/phosphodiesterase n=1 Tax=Chthonobacter rhizosphaerae TaxID=2735553 RepID=UPI0031B5E039